MNRIHRLLVGFALAGICIGCGGQGVKEETIAVKKQDPLLQVKQMLQNYVKGQPLASEVTSYDFLIEDVRKVDAAKADILKAGLEDLQKVKGSPAQKARELLKKLGLDDKSS